MTIIKKPRQPKPQLPIVKGTIKQQRARKKYIMNTSMRTYTPRSGLVAAQAINGNLLLDDRGSEALVLVRLPERHALQSFRDMIEQEKSDMNSGK
jgi:hypothetical protein